MAKTKLPFISRSASGTLGKLITFQRTLRGVKAYRYTPHADAQSSNQLSQRSFFDESRKYWSLLSPTEKAYWESQAKTRYISGYHAWLAWNINGIAFVADNNTVGMWHLNEPAWNGTFGEVKDTSSFNNHGTAKNSLLNIPNERGMGNQADFNGTDKFIETLAYPSLNLTDSISIETIAYIRLFEPSDAIIDKYYASSYGLLILATNRFRFYYGGNHVTTDSHAFKLNEYFYVAVTYDRPSSTCKIYVNSVEKASDTSFDPTVPGNDENLNIGAQLAAPASNFLNGFILEIRLSSTARSLSEIETSWARIKKLLEL